MVTLKTAYGEFTAETVRDAEKASRKAQRDHERQEAARESVMQVARDRAKIFAYGLLSRKAQGQDFPQSYLYTDECNYSCKRTADPAVLSVCDNFGTGDLLHIGYRYVGHVESAAGYCVCVFIQSDNDPVQAVSIGTNEGIAAYAYLPGVVPQDFKPVTA